VDGAGTTTVTPVSRHTARPARLCAAADLPCVTVDPSSLIFLAIIAMWAAYLLGHWVRRRDQLATARSIDRFSESMRVLERRTPTRPVTAARPTARAYVVAPVRAPVRAAAGRPVVDRGRRSPAGAHAFAGAAGTSRAGVTLDGGISLPPSGRPRITREAARRRARLVLTLAVATLAVWLLALVTALVWWLAALVSALLGAVLVQMRRTARRASAPTARSSSRRPAAGSALSARRRSSRRPRGLAARVPAPARRTRRHHQDARAVLRQLSAMRTGASDRTVAIDTSRAAGPLVVDSALLLPAGVIEDVDPHLAQLAATSDDAGVAHQARPVDGGWQPVPVPPPTYTLKPKARPVVRRPVPVTQPGAVDVADGHEMSGSPAPVRADVPAMQDPAPPAFDLDEILERRIAAGG
jgi:hypothetical protein